MQKAAELTVLNTAFRYSQAAVVAILITAFRYSMVPESGTVKQLS